LDFQQLQDEMDRIGDIKEIFVIDTNPGVCQLVERGIGAMKRPLTVRVAYDGENGLTAMRRQPPDLLLLDLMMPEMDGFQVFEQMQRDPILAQVKVILLTATSYPEDRLAQRGSHITIYRADQLRPVEVLRCIPPILSALPPHYGEMIVTTT
ncbi:MAG: response regulator, partial [Chloroflexi bacterium]